MDEERELAKGIYNELKEGDVRGAINLISKKLVDKKTDKLKFTKTTLLNSIGRELGKLLLKEKWKFEKLMELWKNGRRDERLITISALAKISGKEYEKTKNFVLNILEDIDNWEICDQLALKVVSNLAIQNQKEIFSFMEQWKHSENKWLRRLSVATIPPYIRAEPDSYVKCLKFLDGIMEEPDKDVKKAIAWALREVTKKNSGAVFEFLIKWAKIENKNAWWIVKEGMKKLTAAEQEKLKHMHFDK